MIRPTATRTRKLLCLLLLSGSLRAQPVAGVNLLRDIGGTGVVSNIITKRNIGDYLYRFPLELNCGVSYHNYIPFQGGLIAQIDGTGRIYKAEPGKPVFSRVDSTCYEGYNFGAAVFAYKDTLYNLGGYGAWMMNGILRYYNPQVSQWSVLPVSRHVPFSAKVNAFSYFDAAGGKLYLVFRKEKEVYLKPEVPDAQVLYLQCLDLRTHNWWPVEQKINERVVLPRNATDLNYEIHSPWGLITESGSGAGKLALLDFRNNRVLYADQRTQTAIMEGLSAKPHLAYYMRDSVFTIYHPDRDSLVRIPLSIRNFSGPAFPLFREEKKPQRQPFWWVLALGLLVVAAGLLLLFKKRSRQAGISQGEKLPVAAAEPVPAYRPGRFAESLTPQEQAVCALLQENSFAGEATTIDAINRVLGVKNKDSMVQNKLRSDTLKAINQKFQVYAGTSDELVERERTEFDKRVFQYRINERYLKKLV